MSYRLEFRPRADKQTIGLPEDAFTALIEVLAVVARDPFDPDATMSTGDVHVRRVSFGAHGDGIATYYVDPGAGLVKVADVTWTG